MSFKNKIFHEQSKVKDDGTISSYENLGVQRTLIEIRDLDGTLIFKGHNKVIIAGSIYTACNHFDIHSPVDLPNYNTELGLDGSVTTDPTNAKKICLFAVGTDGCGAEDSQIRDVSYTKWLSKDDMVPFIYRSSSDDVSAEDRKRYFGRKTISDPVLGNKIAYYFKAFESDPVLHVQYIDGTPIDSSIYTSTNTSDVEVCVENRLRITPEECREYFKATVGINRAKINTISLLNAWYTENAGIRYYQDIQPVTKYNFSTEHLIDESKGLDIKYFLYY